MDTRWTRWRRRALVAVALAALVAPGTGTAAPAATSDDALTWSVRPADGGQGTGRPNFGYELEPGDVVRDALVVTNRGTAELTLGVYAADAFTTSSGQLDVLTADEPSSDLGTWVTLDTAEVTLAPGQSTDVGFTLAVPAGARPGDHSGGIVTSFRSQQQGQTVALESRLGSRMHVRVTGELVSAATLDDVSVAYHDTWNPFAPSTATVTFTVANTGNTRVTAGGAVAVAGPLGWARAAASDEPVELLPGEVRVHQVEVAGVWPLVRANARVELVAAGVGIGGAPVAPADGTASGWAVPWAAGVAVLLVVLASAWLPGALARRRASARAAVPEGGAVAPEGGAVEASAEGRATAGEAGAVAGR